MRRSRARPARALGVAALAAALLAAGSAAGADGKTLYAACVACHGARGEGVPATGAPNIAGTAAWYLERQLGEFAAGRRGTQPGDSFGATMKAASAVLASDGDRAAVAAYVAGLPRTRAAAPGLPTANGRNYFNAICSACHGSNGLGNEALGAPRLAGLPVSYLARQLAAFKSGRRGAAAGDRLGAQMRAITSMLPDARTEQDVTAYAAGLPP
jgi:cytochrome c oxidase subunit 2